MPDTSTVSSNLLPTIDICKADFNNRIIGGEVAELEEYPWTVLLQYDKRTLYKVNVPDLME